jgi:hypothetical protein
MSTGQAIDWIGLDQREWKKITHAGREALWSALFVSEGSPGPTLTGAGTVKNFSLNFWR